MLLNMVTNLWPHFWAPCHINPLDKLCLSFKHFSNILKCLIIIINFFLRGFSCWEGLSWGMGCLGLAISIMVWLVLNMVAWEKLDDPKIKLCLKLEVRQVVPYDRCTRTTKMTMSISTTKWLISTSISKNYHNFMIYNLQLAKPKEK